MVDSEQDEKPERVLFVFRPDVSVLVSKLMRSGPDAPPTSLKKNSNSDRTEPMRPGSKSCTR